MRTLPCASRGAPQAGQQAGSPQHRGKPGWQPWALLAATGAASASEKHPIVQAAAAISGNLSPVAKVSLGGKASIPRSKPLLLPAENGATPKKVLLGQKGPCLPACRPQ